MEKDFDIYDGVPSVIVCQSPACQVWWWQDVICQECGGCREHCTCEVPDFCEEYE